MRWLHISDLHFGRNNQSQKLAIAGLVAMARQEVGSKALDAIIISGDIAHSGKAPEYEFFEATLVGPLRTAFPGARIIAVPGNHDIDCDKALPLTWSTLGPRRQTMFFDRTSDAIALRLPRTQGFLAYSASMKRAGIDAQDPSQACAETIHLEEFDLVLINTGLFSDYVRTPDCGPAPVAALRAASGQLEAQRPKLVVGHHPIREFETSTQQPLRTALRDMNALYLHGHLHKVESTATAYGIESIGFGASYQAAADVKTEEEYTNHFAICETDTSKLHIAFYVWDYKHGKWVGNQQLPVDFSTESTVLPGGFVVPLPGPNKRSLGAAPGIERRPPRAESIVLVGTLTKPGWERLLRVAGIVPVGTILTQLSEPKSGRNEFYYSAPNKHRVVAIAAPGHTLSVPDVETENALFDAEDYSSISIVSIGQFAKDAGTLITRLSSKKALQGRSNAELAKLIYERLPRPATEHISTLDAAKHDVSIVVTDSAVVIQVSDRLSQAWFYLMDEKGEILPETSPAVANLRAARESFAALHYGDSKAPAAPARPEREKFSRAEYLAASKRAFDELSYPALATVGVRLPTAKLRDVYISATADVAPPSEAHEANRRSVDAALEGLQLEESLKQQLEVQIRRSRAEWAPKESGSAATVHRHRGSLLVLGDPGSGKTCFAKNELLSYCEGTDSWYERHTPVYVSLSEAVALVDRDRDIVDIAAALAKRRGLAIDAKSLQELVANGLVAFFFDGLDEVGSAEQRASIMDLIGNLVRTAAPIGNRFIVTSRPAAVQLVKIPDGLTTIHLRGLNNADIGVLARAVLRVEISNEERVKINQESNPARERAVDKLLAEVDRNPSLRRMASNPLLLTMLVMIYTNSGPVAAKRHRIYAQAVQTLVSVRNRVVGGRVLSEADLKHRLGSMALSLFERGGIDVPRRSQVQELVLNAMRETNPSASAADASDFLQAVAESTGLLVFSRREGDPAGDTTTFMHHSFFEYYVAVGAIAKHGAAGLVQYSEQPRWKEILALVGGMLGDTSDVAVFVDSLLRDRASAFALIGGRLALAFDCAIECDVPSERAIALLIDATKDLLEDGMLLVDPQLREEIGDRVGRLAAASGSPLIEGFILAGLSHKDVTKRAAYVDLASRIGIHSPPSSAQVRAFEECGRSRDSTLRVAVLGALARSRELRTEPLIKCLREALSGTTAVRLAGALAVEVAPGLAPDVWSELVNCVEDEGTSPVQQAAARALLAAGMDPSTGTEARLLDRCIQLWTASAVAGERERIRLLVERDELSLKLTSPDRHDRTAALGLLPWLAGETEFSRTRLMSALKAPSTIEVRVALGSLRVARETLGALTIDDIEFVSGLMVHPEEGVRIAAVRVVGQIPNDQVVTSRLIERLSSSRGDEFCEVVRALSRRDQRSDEFRRFVIKEVETRLRPRQGGAQSFGDDFQQAELVELLNACETFSAGDVSARLPDLIRELADSYRTPKPIRRQACKSFAKLAAPGRETTDTFAVWLRSNFEVFESAISQATFIHVQAARRSVDAVRAIYPYLGTLQTHLAEKIVRALLQDSHRIDDVSLRWARVALREVNGLRVEFSEFDRAHASLNVEGSMDRSQRERPN